MTTLGPHPPANITVTERAVELALDRDPTVTDRDPVVVAAHVESEVRASMEVGQVYSNQCPHFADFGDYLRLSPTRRFVLTSSDIHQRVAYIVDVAGFPDVVVLATVNRPFRQSGPL